MAELQSTPLVMRAQAGDLHSRDSPGTAASDTDDGNGRAGEAHKGVDVLYDDTEARENGGHGGAVGLLDGVAALDGAGAAGRVRRGCGGGDGKDCEGGEREELSEHVGEEEEYLNDG